MVDIPLELVAAARLLCGGGSSDREQQHTDRQAAHDSNPRDDRSAHGNSLAPAMMKSGMGSAALIRPCETRLRRDGSHFS
jgi:hypothetical protein